jgi:signal transduction histidine kinase
MRNEYTGRAAEAGLKLTVVPCSLTVRSDPMLLERMLRNLIENAIRFTRHGAILIGCRRRGDKASIEVLDTGIGIAPVHQKAIFEEFHQLNNPERSAAKGLGLGLSIVRRMGRLLGHDVTVDSEPGKGSRFCIGVTVSAASDLETHVAPPQSTVSSGGFDDRPKVGSMYS